VKRTEKFPSTGTLKCGESIETTGLIKGGDRPLFPRRGRNSVSLTPDIETPSETQKPGVMTKSWGKFARRSEKDLPKRRLERLHCRGKNEKKGEDQFQ